MVPLAKCTHEEVVGYLTKLIEESPEDFGVLEAEVCGDENRWPVPQIPTERQALFLGLTNEREVFYGGAAGGGKSSALLMGALEHVHVPGYAALLLRRTYADLSKPGALMDRAQQWLRGTGAKWNDQKKQWTFPSGATLTFGYIDTENDKYQYQGAEYQYIGFDELTQFSESAYLYLFSRLRRLETSDVPLRMRSGSNPGGVGSRWVNERFVPDTFTPDQAKEAHVFKKEGRSFVPARLDDNPYLDRVAYAESLNELDPVTREQLLRGDWQITERGNILPMWDENRHLVTWGRFAEVFGQRHIPNTWLLSVYQDWGSTADHPCVTSWFGTVPENCPPINGVKMAGKVFLYRQLVIWDATVREVAELINQRMAPLGEKSRVHRWQMSHEAASERMAYQREHGLSFSAWPTGKTRGIAQLRNALEAVELTKRDPMNPALEGHCGLYHIVDNKQRVFARDDDGLARHRAEAPAYRWAQLKSGEPATALVPHALFNDAMDTVRAAAADYWPRALALSIDERVERALVATAPHMSIEAIEQGASEHNRDYRSAMTARAMAISRIRRNLDKPVFVSALDEAEYEQTHGTI
jgi:hypothetical protein